MSICRLTNCRAKPPWMCEDGCRRVPNGIFDVLNVGFGLYSPFPDALLGAVRTGGYLLVPTCFKKSRRDAGYCHEDLTLFRKMADGKIERVSSVSPKTVIPRVEGEFVDVSRP